MDTGESGLFSNEYYWAATEDPDELVAFTEGRIKDFQRTLRSSRLWARIYRNWKYYHGMYWSGGDGERDVRYLGDQGEYAGLSVNHVRNLIGLLLTLTTKNEPVFDARAVNTDAKSLQQAKLANSVLEAYRQEKRLGQVYKAAAEDALVLSAGYVYMTWDPSAGRELAVDPETFDVMYQGDLRWSNPKLWDVGYDLTCNEWREQEWVIVREYENRWNLAARFPQFRDEIISYQQDAELEYLFRIGIIDPAKYRDRVPVLNFYHKRTDALPYGRFAKIACNEVLLDLDTPYRDLPVDRCVPATYMLTPFGYTPTFDLQGLQEGINTELSAILTNHTAFGVQSIWVPTGSNITVKDLGDGLNAVESDVKPEGLNLTQTPAEIFQFAGVLKEQMELVSGINSVARGQPEASLRTGNAIALVDAKATESASGLIRSFQDLIEDNGTKMIRVLTDFAKTERVIAITGVHNRHYMKAFTGDQLSQVSRVTVLAGNPLTRTMSGRMEMADRLITMGAVKNRDEYLNFIQTGQFDVIMEFENSQLAIVREENEGLLVGQPHRALAIDNHVLHIKEHSSLMGTTEARLDPVLSANALAAVMEHLWMLMDPLTQQLQITLGYDVTVPAIPGIMDQMGGQGEEGTHSPDAITGSPSMLSGEGGQEPAQQNRSYAPAA